MRRLLAPLAILLGVVAFVCLPLAALAQRRGGVPFGLNWNRGRPTTSALLSMSLTGNCEGTTPSGLTFTRTSTATCTRADGSLTTVASGAPRLEAQGLLVEGAATNLVLRSAELNDATWAAFGSAVVTADSTAAPDGLLVAERVDFADTTTASSFTGVQQSLTGASAIHSLSCYAKAVSGTPTLHPYIKGTAQVSTPCPLTSTAWTRCTTTMTVAGVPTFATIGVDTRAGQTGQPPFSAYVWGCQLEASPVATSYIPTQGTQVTRAADAPTPAWPVSAGGNWRVTSRVCPGASSAVLAPLLVTPWQLSSGTLQVRASNSAGLVWQVMAPTAAFSGAIADTFSAGACRRFVVDWVDATGVASMSVYDGATSALIGSASATAGAALSGVTSIRLGFSNSPGRELRGHVSDICIATSAGGCP